jgi:putative oxidoreductase
VDWKRLVQFALMGSSDLEQYAILLVRVSSGLFVAISGANKLFVAGRTKTMYETLVEAKVRFPHCALGALASDGLRVSPYLPCCVREALE